MVKHYYLAKDIVMLNLINASSLKSSPCELMWISEVMGGSSLTKDKSPRLSPSLPDAPAWQPAQVKYR